MAGHKYLSMCYSLKDLVCLWLVISIYQCGTHHKTLSAYGWSQASINVLLPKNLVCLCMVNFFFINVLFSTRSCKLMLSLKVTSTYHCGTRHKTLSDYHAYGWSQVSINVLLHKRPSLLYSWLQASINVLLPTTAPLSAYSWLQTSIKVHFATSPPISL